MSKRRKTVAHAPHQDNTLRRLAYLQRLGALPRVGLTSCVVYHDAWCAHFRGGACNCDPDVRVKWTQPDASKN